MGTTRDHRGATAGHDGRMTATPAWPAPGPIDRDELAEWTTAQSSDRGLGDVPPLGGPLAPGWTELVDDRGVLVRRTPGPPGSVPVWCVHGLGGSSADWVRLSGALSSVATVFSVDLPGSGRSDPPPDGRYSPVLDADLVGQVIEQVSGGPVHLVGNSYGGVVATLVAARRPDLVMTLTVISPAVPDLRLTRDRGADPRLGLLLMPGTARLAHQRLGSIAPMARARGMGELCFGHPELITEDDYAVAAQEHIRRATLPWTYSAMVGTLRGLMAGYLRRGALSFAAAAASVRVPVLVVWGTRDRLVDVRLAQRTAASYQDAELLVLAECGHVAQMEDPLSTARGILGLWERRPRPDGRQVGRAAAAGRPHATPADGGGPAPRAGSVLPVVVAASSTPVPPGGGAASAGQDRTGRAVPAHSVPYGNLIA
jgi:pimeloyl-ACP methyl ester carboxylesterase